VLVTLQNDFAFNLYRLPKHEIGSEGPALDCFFRRNPGILRAINGVCGKNVTIFANDDLNEYFEVLLAEVGRPVGKGLFDGLYGYSGYSLPRQVNRIGRRLGERFVFVWKRLNELHAELQKEFAPVSNMHCTREVVSSKGFYIVVGRLKPAEPSHVAQYG
jgi:hypothetical protein